MASTLTKQMFGDASSETFAKLWVALQNHYEGTNITRTVSRLLHMYQPEDGIQSYERLLRTLYVLLEDFDRNGFRILVSMIPPPTDIPESTIQEIFQKATGFTRITSISQSHFVISEKEGTKMKVEDSKKFNETSQTISSDPVEFRGFPSNEICKTQIRVQNINQLHEPTQYNTCNHNSNHQTSGKLQDQQNPNSSGTSINCRMKWVYTPYLLRKNAICQSTQLLQDSLVIFQTADQKHVGIPMSQINQFQRGDYSHPNKQPAFIDLSNGQEEKVNLNSRDKKKVSLRGNDDCIEEMKENLSFKNLIEEEKGLHEQETNFLKEEVRLRQRAIQEDIFKMDVVQPNLMELNSIVVSQIKDLEPEDLDAHNELRESVKKFLRKAKSEETIPEPSVTKSVVKSSNPTTEKPVTDETSAFIDCWKKIITKSVLGRDPKSNSTNSDKNIVFSKEKADAPLKKENEKKIRKKKSNPPLRPKSERVAHRTPNRIFLEEMENQSSSSKNFKRNNNFNCNKEATSKEHNLSYPINSCELNTINMLQQANSMSEIATYKKQYYDALLSIQRAKVAVANSLAISSVGNTNSYDPYFLNYLHRQQQLMQNQQRFLIGTQFSNQRPLLPVLSNNRTASNFLTNCNDWRYPSFGQYRFPRHTHAVYSSSMNPSTYSFLPQDTGEISQCGQLRPNFKRKKLEEIVGKLKEPEDFTLQQNSSL